MPNRKRPLLKWYNRKCYRRYIQCDIVKYWPKLKNRADKGDTPYNLRNCAYLEDFDEPKIVWNRIAAIKQFAIADKGIYIQDSMHFITGSNLNYLVSVLNSKIIQWLLSLIIGEAAGGNAGNADNIWNLCIPKIDIDQAITDFDLYSFYGLTTDEAKYIESKVNY